MEFKNLACLIVDEEQRFGVGHKERLKNAKKGIHVLSMSATARKSGFNMVAQEERQGYSYHPPTELLVYYTADDLLTNEVRLTLQKVV